MPLRVGRASDDKATGRAPAARDDDLGVVSADSAGSLAIVGNGGVPRLIGMSVIRLPIPEWLEPWSCPLIEDVVRDLSSEHQRLYVKHLAEAVHRGERQPPSLAWLALDRASMEIMRRRRAEREGGVSEVAAGGVA